MYVTPEDKVRIEAAAESNILQVIQSEVTLKKQGASFVGKCPFCDSESGFTVTPGKELFKCFKCNVGGKGAIKFLTQMGKGYGEALNEIARRLNVPLTEKKVIPY
ncbi:MAG: CHC2 zinc finger domain-containing protein, partial [Bacteroidales bacterium]|nr:CHC2 zinc finger domain-containing protein [Bacteroidales bacterium]